MKDSNELLSKRLYSIKEAAMYIGRSERALREMIWAKKIAVIRDGKRILLDIRDINEWIETHKESVDPVAA